MFFVVRLWDAVADIFAGRLVDRTMTRMGKFRPFILFGAVPLLFLSALTFHVPSSLDDGAKLLYAYVTYAALGLAYSLVNIPYGSLASAMTQSVNERAKLVAARFFGGAVGGIVLTYIIAPQISDLKKQKGSLTPAQYQEQLQSIFTQTTVLFILVGSAAYLVTFFLCREKVVRTQPRVSMRETWDTLRHNKPLGYLCAASFFYLIGLFAVGGASAFYAQYVLGDIKWIGPITLVNSGISIIAAPFVPKLVDRFGKKDLFQYCGLFTIVGGVALFFTPAGAVVPALIFLGIKGIGGTLDQHGDVRSGGRHRRVRRVEVRQALARVPPTPCSPSPARSPSRSVAPSAQRPCRSAATSRPPRRSPTRTSPSRPSPPSGSPWA